jgi:ABC-2 type transport system permease protein
LNILNIAIKEIKTSLRQVQTLLFMLAFPILLMLILGTALTNAFSSSAKVGDMQLLYLDRSSNPQLTEYWQGFSKAIGQEGIEIIPLASGKDGRTEISDDKYTGYVELNDEGMKYYGSSKRSIESNIIQGMLTAFSDQYNLAAAAFKVDPAQAQKMIAGSTASPDFIKDTSLDPDKTPGSLDYYAISITTMNALYAALSGSFLFRSERTRNTAIRLIASPVSKAEIFIGKVLGCTLINLLAIVAVVLFSKFAYHADWGNHYGTVFLVLGTEVILSISLGLGLSFLLKGDNSRAIIMIFTQIASFIGGAYFPIEVGPGGGFFGILTNLSPLRWANTALIKIIYSDDLRAALPAIGLNVGIAAAFLITAALIMRKREAF